MTSEQQKDSDRLERYIATQSLVQVMNDTKWREAIAALGSINGYSVRFRVRCLGDAANLDANWDFSFPWHVPSPFKAIEWLDIDPVVRKRVGALLPPKTEDYRDAICSALDRFSVPHDNVGDVIRIPGYIRLGKASR